MEGAYLFLGGFRCLPRSKRIGQALKVLDSAEMTEKTGVAARCRARELIMEMRNFGSKKDGWDVMHLHPA